MSNMEQDPLSALRDIHLPEPGGFWPPAPGWWIVFALVIGLTVWGTLAILQKRRRNRWLKTALAELTTLAAAEQRGPGWFNELNRLLKRAARVKFPQQRPESLSGEAWVRFLTETSPGQATEDQALFRSLVESCWRPDPGGDPCQALGAARRWLEAQRC
ncbi:DUF4381 domain-containing protein [Marinobacter changyiensis]|uniref:DUF4381 domain-containing protein n=1 Tax=Marinobacter changyiensis TaxID=2604091 RepID=UPI001FE336D8|nr:DUF4381 domain-containing protein [Marinobacter changyiensis]